MEQPSLQVTALTDSEQTLLLLVIYLSSVIGLLSMTRGPAVCMSSAFFLISDAGLFWWHFLEITANQKQDWYNFVYVALTTPFMAFGRFDSCVNDEAAMMNGYYDVTKLHYKIPFYAQLFMFLNGLIYFIVDFDVFSDLSQDIDVSDEDRISVSMNLAVIFHTLLSMFSMLP